MTLILKLVAAIVLAFGVVVAASAQTHDSAKDMISFPNIKSLCSAEASVSDVGKCAYFVLGFIEAMAFQEHLSGLEPQCVGTANYRDLGNRAIKRVRSNASVETWTGIALTVILLEEAGCKYVKLKNPSRLPRD